MRVGELLLSHGWVQYEDLVEAISNQPPARLCSVLIARGAVDFDHASRALGEQLGVAAVLRKHLERRDRTLAALLDPDIAQSRAALPIGRLGSGQLIVAVRDPAPALASELKRAIGEPIMLAVAPAKYLERLIAQTYRSASAEIDVPIIVDVDGDGVADAVEIDFDADPEASGDIPIDIELEPVPPPPPAEPPKPVEPPRPVSRSLPVEIKPKMTAPPARDSLDAAIAACRDIDEVSWLLDVGLAYVAKTWTSWLLLEVRERRAYGTRGSGPRLGTEKLVKAVVIPLADPSIVQVARDEKRLVEEPPPTAGKVQSAMVTALDNAERPAAAPLVKGDTVTHVIVVGAPTKGDPEDSAVDLGLLAEAMSTALSKM